jgi:polar amino acid transport system permease protein
MTLGIFALTLVCSIPLGMILALLMNSRIKPLKWILNVYVWLMRGTPLLLQLIFVFYGLPLLKFAVGGYVFSFTMSRFGSALFAFILNYTAYFAEIFRGGIQSIPRGQYEAAKVLRLSRWQTARKIVIPQVIKIVLPSVGNEVINLVKDSSLVYVVGLGDLLKAGKIAMSRDVTLLPLILVGMIYLAMTAVFTFILKHLEKHYQYYK